MSASNKTLRAQIDAESPEEVMSSCTKFMDAEIHNSALPYPDFLRAPVPTVPTDIISQEAVMPLDFLRREREGCYALDELLATMLALKAYHSEIDGYPSTLEALTPKYLARIPIDPFTDGKPMTYKLSAVGYLLYSVGPDGKDDGGTPIFNVKSTGVAQHRVNVSILDHAVQPGDIVAGVNY